MKLTAERKFLEIPIFISLGLVASKMEKDIITVSKEVIFFLNMTILKMEPITYTQYGVILTVILVAISLKNITKRSTSNKFKTQPKFHLVSQK